MPKDKFIWFRILIYLLLHRTHSFRIVQKGGGSVNFATGHRYLILTMAFSEPPIFYPIPPHGTHPFPTIILQVCAVNQIVFTRNTRNRPRVSCNKEDAWYATRFHDVYLRFQNRKIKGYTQLAVTDLVM